MGRRTLPALLAGLMVVAALAWAGGRSSAHAAARLGPPAPSAQTGAVAQAVLVNLFWDPRWNHDDGNLGMDRRRVDRFVAALVRSGYFDALSQYGVGRPSFAGGTVADPACGARAPAAVGPASVAGFVLCEARLHPRPVPPGRLVVNVLLPPSTRSDLGRRGRCLGSQGAGPQGLFNYHGDTANHAPGPDIPFTVVATGCAEAAGGGVPFGDAYRHFTWALSHEIVEALTDPHPGYGWIDPAFGREGEAADLCEPPGQPPVPFADALVTPYWSNLAGSCAVPSTVPSPVPTPAAVAPAAPAGATASTR